MKKILVLNFELTLYTQLEIMDILELNFSPFNENFCSCGGQDTCYYCQSHNEQRLQFEYIGDIIHAPTGVTWYSTSDKFQYCTIKDITE